MRDVGMARVNTITQIRTYARAREHTRINTVTTHAYIHTRAHTHINTRAHTHITRSRNNSFLDTAEIYYSRKFIIISVILLSISHLRYTEKFREMTWNNVKWQEMTSNCEKLWETVYTGKCWNDDIYDQCIEMTWNDEKCREIQRKSAHGLYKRRFKFTRDVN